MGTLYFIAAIACYVMTLSIFTIGMMFLRIPIALLSLLPGAATVLLARASGSVWIPAFERFAGEPLSSANGILIAAFFVVFTLCVFVIAFTRTRLENFAFALVELPDRWTVRNR